MKGVCTLSLFGTIHCDPLGPSTLLRLLKEADPAAVTVEISAFSLRYRRRCQQGWMETFQSNRSSVGGPGRFHANLVLVQRQLLMPFEWVVSEAYSASCAIPCIPVDSSTISREGLPTWTVGLLSSNNLEALSSGPDFDVSERFAGLYSQAEGVLRRRRDWFAEAHPLRWLGEGGGGDRERMMAQRVRRVLRRRSPVVHVGGWEHLVVDERWCTVASLLRDLRPRRVLLRGDSAVPLDD